MQGRRTFGRKYSKWWQRITFWKRSSHEERNSLDSFSFEEKKMFFLFVPSWEKEEWRRQYRGKRHFKVFPPFLTHHVTHTRRAHSTRGFYGLYIDPKLSRLPGRFPPVSFHQVNIFDSLPIFFLSVLLLLVIVVPFGVFIQNSPRFFCLTSAEVWKLFVISSVYVRSCMGYLDDSHNKDRDHRSSNS